MKSRQFNFRNALIIYSGLTRIGSLLSGTFLINRFFAPQFLKMDSTRQQKFARLIQKELAEIFTREGKHFFGNAFATVTSVKVTPDLSIARVYMSLFKEKNPQAVIDNLHNHMHEVRGKLGNRIKSQARHIPELEFFLDDTLDYVEKMEDIFKKLHIPPTDEQIS